MAYRRSATARYSGEAPALALPSGTRARNGSAAISTSTSRMSPARMASCRAVSPASFYTLRSAATLSSPARRTRRASISTLPALAAQCKGVSCPLLRASRRCLALP